MNVERKEPSWWSSRGYAMTLVSNHPQLMIANDSRAASLEINHSTDDSGWMVKWMVAHASDTYDAGQRAATISYVSPGQHLPKIHPRFGSLSI